MIQPFDIAIDVSDNNGAIDWPAVHAAGIKIAFVKAMEGVGRDYPTWGPQSEGANQAGLIVIPYLFLRPCDPKVAAAHFRQVTGLGPGMAFALDWEGRASQTATPPVAEAIGEELARIAERKPIGYWGLPGSTPAAPTEAMRAWPRWVPRYPVIGTNSWKMLPDRARLHPQLYWPGGRAQNDLPHFGQYTAWGRVAGIQGVVDRSVAFFPSLADALTWCTGVAPDAKAAGKPLERAAPAAAAGVAAKPASPHPAAPSAPHDGEKTADDLNRAELDRLARQ